MKLTFLITVHNEAKELRCLLSKIKSFVSGNNSDVIILDDYSDDKETIDILNEYSNKEKYQVHKHHLNKDFGAHKQYGNSLVSKDSSHILQLDADEYPSDFLLENIFELLEHNSDIDLFLLPRVNIITGLSNKEILRYGWQITKSQFLSETFRENINIDQYDFLKNNGYILMEGSNVIKHLVPLINWESGDYQGRLYRNDPKVKWIRPLHEHIIGAEKYTHLPKEYDFAIFHPKTIDRQVKQNEFYNKNFTQQDNIRQ